MTQPRERRRAPRIETRVPLTIAVPAGAVAAATRNLSSSGVYCEVDQAIALMTRVEAIVNLPGNPLRCQGVVVRCEPATERATTALRYRVAIFFTRITARDRRTIAHFVAQHLETAANVNEQPPQQLRAIAFRQGAPFARWLGWVGLSLLLQGCQAHFAVIRGAQTRPLVDELTSTADARQRYTFRWLSRRSEDQQSHQRFDGLVVDLRGRNMRMIRQADGEHVLLIGQSEAAPGARLTIAPGDLPTLQAVVRRYHFTPHVIINPIGEPQVVIYAPVTTGVSVAPSTAMDGIRVEVRRGAAQAPLLMSD